MNEPFLSIVTISFNQGRYLERCLESVAQQAGSYEHIVVDAGSSDESRSIIGRRRESLAETILEPDDGPADGLNKGFRKARGRIGYFLNADDFLLPGAVEQMLRAWEATDGCGFRLFGAWKVAADERPLGMMLPKRLDGRSLSGGAATLVQQGLSFRMELFNAVDGFNAANRTCWDLELVSAFVAAGARHQVSNGRLGAFRLHEEGISGGAGGEALARRYRLDLERIRGHYFGNLPNRQSRLGHGLAVMATHIRHPARTLALAGHRFFPPAMKAAWRADSGLGRRA